MIKQIIFGLSILVSTFGCNHQESYLEAKIANGISSGERHDSLFLGVRLGMKRQEFYDHCWELNRQQLIKEGSNNTSVRYLFRDSIGNQIEFNFYPEFIDGIAYKYNTSFNYYSWAPWNSHLQSQNMFEFLPHLLADWYGEASLIRVLKNNKEILYRIDGNRKIEITILDERYVSVTFTDMTFPKNK